MALTNRLFAPLDLIEWRGVLWDHRLDVHFRGTTRSEAPFCACLRSRCTFQQRGVQISGCWLALYLVRRDRANSGESEQRLVRLPASVEEK
jgi:hypothetical protein